MEKLYKILEGNKCYKSESEVHKLKSSLHRKAFGVQVQEY